MTRAAAAPTGDLAGLIEEYLDELAPRVGGHTLRLRRTALERLLIPWADQQDIHTLDELDKRAIARFSLHLQNDPGPKGKIYTEQTVKSYSLQVNLFLKWAAEQAGDARALQVESPPLRDGRLSKRDLLTREEVKAMEDAATWPRDKLIVRVLADTGIRVGELLSLRPCDVVRERGRDGDRCMIAVWGKEGGRTVGIEPALYRRLRALAEARPGGDQDPLFVTLARTGRRAGHGLSASGAEQVVKELGRAAGIQKRVYPHLLRHSFATDYHRTTRDPLTLREILGHKDMRMIDRTYVHLSADDAHDAILGYHAAKKKEARR